LAPIGGVPGFLRHKHNRDRNRRPPWIRSRHNQERNCLNTQNPLTSIFLLLRFISEPFKLLNTRGAPGVGGAERVSANFHFTIHWEGCAHAIAVNFRPNTNNAADLGSH
jgi:hypothetical protein